MNKTQWTTVVEHADHETGEILTTNQLHYYTLVNTVKDIRQTAVNKYEKLIIKLYERSKQQSLF